MSKLSTLFVRNLVFSGVHGSTGREILDPQRFEVNLEINLDVTKASLTDRLSDTYDYKDAVFIAREVIEKESHVLIEKIAEVITERICSDPKIYSVKVSLRKLDASDQGIPGIVFSKKRLPQESEQKILDFDVKDLVETLNKEHGASIPILSESYRKVLLEEAETYNYIKQPEVVGPAKVREQLSSVSDFKGGSLFFRLKSDFEKILDKKLNSLPEYPFATKLSFNEMSLQLYEKGSIGITPHLDGKSCLNLVCVFILTGQAKFALCDDREGNNPRYLDTSPGNVIIFRHPGFMNSDFRPFHFLSDVTERRIVFGLRQKSS